MRSFVRRATIVVAGCGSLAMAGTGVAHADVADRGPAARIVQAQQNDTDQRNTVIAPITQVNPVIDADVFGDGGGDIDQDNSIESRNEQSNDNRTGQTQDASASSGSDRRGSAEVEQSQRNETTQDNTVVAPITQVNPVVDVDVAEPRQRDDRDDYGDDRGDHGDDRGGNIEQDNSVDSRNEQRNSNATVQDQVADVVGGLGRIALG